MHGSEFSRPIEILLVEDNPADVTLTRKAMERARVRNTLHVVESPTTFVSMAADGLILLGDLLFPYDRTWIAWGLYAPIGEVVLAHELGHHLLATADRRRGRRAHRWNCATDYAINRIVAAIEHPARPGERLYRSPDGTHEGLVR